MEAKYEIKYKENKDSMYLGADASIPRTFKDYVEPIKPTNSIEDFVKNSEKERK